MKSSSLSKPLPVIDREGLSTLEYSVVFVIIVVGTLGFWSKLSGEPMAHEPLETPVTQSAPSAR